MASAVRTYKVVEKADSKDGKVTVAVRLVKASNPAQALRHVAEPRFEISVAKMDDVVELVSKGTKVEIAVQES